MDCYMHTAEGSDHAIFFMQGAYCTLAGTWQALGLHQCRRRGGRVRASRDAPGLNWGLVCSRSSTTISWYTCLVYQWS